MILIQCTLNLLVIRYIDDPALWTPFMNHGWRLLLTRFSIFFRRILAPSPSPLSHPSLALSSPCSVPSPLCSLQLPPTPFLPRPLLRIPRLPRASLLQHLLSNLPRRRFAVRGSSRQIFRHALALQPESSDSFLELLRQTSLGEIRQVISTIFHYFLFVYWNSWPDCWRFEDWWCND